MGRSLSYILVNQNTTLLFRISPFVSDDDFCGVKLPTQSIKHDRFNRGPNNFDEDQDKMKGTLSKKAINYCIFKFRKNFKPKLKRPYTFQETPIILSKYIPTVL